MKKLTKQLLTGVVALSLFAPVAASALNPIQTTVSAHRIRRRIRRPARHGNKRRAHRSARITGYARWFASRSKAMYRHYHSRRSFMNGVNDGLNGGVNDGGAIIDMDSITHAPYYKGWVIANAINRSGRTVNDGFIRTSARNYNSAIRLWNQGKHYGGNNGDKYVQYNNGAWRGLPATDFSDVGSNTNVLSTLYGNYEL